MHTFFFSGRLRLILAAVLSTGICCGVLADVTVNGRVVDLNGRAMQQAMVTIEPGPDTGGPAATTVFTDTQGGFRFPDPIREISAGNPPITVKVLDYRQGDMTVRTGGSRRNRTADVTVIMEPDSNQAGIAPASAWMSGIDEDTKEKLIMNCVGCHQYPAPEVRNYARLVHEVETTDPENARLQSWQDMVRYMNFLSAEEFGRGIPGAGPVEADRVYGVSETDLIPKLLAEHMQGPMARVTGYDYGAPLAVNPDTVIREYAAVMPNNIREALLLGDPPRLWAADVGSNDIVAIDVETGRQKIYTVPSEIPVGPHTLVRGRDDTLWVAPFFNGVVAHLDVHTGDWQVWPLNTKNNANIGIHDLSFDHNHNLTTDNHGRIWFSDIVNNGVGYFDPQTGLARVFDAPDIEGRPGRGASLYGLAMTTDRKYLWYAQVGIGNLGCFNTETLEFETQVTLPDMDSGPRRITINDQDILYAALYGAGQLLEYDTQARRLIGVYNLPDRASAPYAVTWDNVRRVVWIPTSNANVIYRFDPADKSISVLPLPREQGFLRMVGVDPKTGHLATSYANISIPVQGPRMALMIDPGDDYQALKDRMAGQQ